MALRFEITPQSKRITLDHLLEKFKHALEEHGPMRLEVNDPRTNEIIMITFRLTELLRTGEDPENEFTIGGYLVTDRGSLYMEGDLNLETERGSLSELNMIAQNRF